MSSSGTEPNWGITVDAQNRTATVRGRNIKLTRHEFHALSLLCDTAREAPGTFTTKADFARRLWPQEINQRVLDDKAEPCSARVIENIIYQLRQKLDEDKRGNLIENSHGIGYRLLPAPSVPADPSTEPSPSLLSSLWAQAIPSDALWPVIAEPSLQRSAGGVDRGLGAPQGARQYRYRLGSRIRLVIQIEQPGHLLLLDEGPEGTVFCLCPSWFAPDSGLQKGRNYLPQRGSRYEAFVVSGSPGYELLLAIVTDAPLTLDWLPDDPTVPARVLSEADIALLHEQLLAQDEQRWRILTTYFEILA